MFKKSKNAAFSMGFLVVFPLILCLAACGASNAASAPAESMPPTERPAGDASGAFEPKNETAFLLDTVVTVTYYDEQDSDAVQSALALCGQYELVFSRTDPDSELYRLNAAGGGTVSDDIRTVLKTALHFCERSGGRLDVTMGKLSAMYGFTSDAPRLPSPEEIADALTHVNYQGIHLDGNTLNMDDLDAVIDLGSIAKGYIADRMKADMIAHGVEHAIINLGGNVLCIGVKPDGSDYKIGIQYPEKSSTKTVTTIRINDLSVVTSGVYQRFFEQDGVTYHHILDPETGYSVENGLMAVSIIGRESMLCDALSTTCFALGLEDGMALIDSIDDYYAVFITADHALYYSAGFADTFEFAK